MDVLEKISYFRSDPFNLIDLVLPTNSYMIACTNTQIFVEEGEHSASAISVAHLEPLFLILGSDITLISSNFKFQEPQIILVAVLINFGVKKQAPQVSFKNSVVGDSISVSSHALTDALDSDSLEFFESISDYGAQSSTLIDLPLPANSYMIACTNTHSFVEEGENRASTILVEHLEYLFHTLRYNMIIFGLNFNFKII